ncbi:MAG: erythromycin esterase family protein, partial [Bacteroidota bacterium]
GVLRENIITTIGNSGSSNYIFSYLTHKNFIIRWKEVTSRTARNWLDQTRPFLSIGAVYSSPSQNYYFPALLLREFDVMIYFDDTHSTDLLR